VNFDCSNVDEVAKKIENKPKFKFEKLKDSYDTILAKGKSKYQEDIKTKVLVKCKMDFFDIEAQKNREPGNQWYVNKIRADKLVNLNLVVIV
jgi:hypothetical protein